MKHLALSVAIVLLSYILAGAATRTKVHVSPGGTTDPHLQQMAKVMAQALQKHKSLEVVDEAKDADIRLTLVSAHVKGNGKYSIQAGGVGDFYWADLNEGADKLVSFLVIGSESCVYLEGKHRSNWSKAAAKAAKNLVEKCIED